MRIILTFLAVVTFSFESFAAEFQAGAAVVDVTPETFPVTVNGNMLSKTAEKITSRVYARAIVLDDGKERLGIVVVDSCMVGRPLLDEAKQLASQQTKIKPDRILISATHTHSAPASMGALGTSADPSYVPFLRVKLAEALATAEENLESAQVGFATQEAAEFTALRRWILRPDRVRKDPFGNPTVRANMHAGGNHDNVTGESGPEDPDLSIISIQSRDGRPIAVLANFSMHYFSGQTPISSDYFGLYCNGLETMLDPKGDKKKHPPFVAAMSHGCSGDIWRRDYKKPANARDNSWTIDTYTDGLLRLTMRALAEIKYKSDISIAMAESRMKLNYRVPDAQRLQWAQQIVEKMGDRLPESSLEVYAREQIILHERQSTEIVVQALRIGDIAIATTPNETYALTGLKLKNQSPIKKTMVIELANGGDGYIPPPEQHVLGGYNTWAARSAGLEVQAEPKIVERLLTLLEEVADSPRRKYQQSRGLAFEEIVHAKPAAYWRLDEMSGGTAIDSSGHGNDGTYEPAVAFFLAGPQSDQFCLGDETNRAAHFAGDRMSARVAGLADKYTVSMWIWNGMPNDARETAGWMFSRGRDHGLDPRGEHLGIGGTATDPGKLVFLRGKDKPIVGMTVVERWKWHHVALVRDADAVVVYLDGKPEIEARLADHKPLNLSQLFVGGRSDRDSNWEGRLDEVAIFNRPLKPSEIKRICH